jgi:peptidoglycan/LPS O-acetylase OafA/YrhL
VIADASHSGARHLGSVRSRALPYMPGLDGVRAVAVVAVLLFHLPGPAWSGGFLGVDVFFVLSGFLITALLLAEVSTTGRIAFGRFYLRRARRLIPALIAMLIVVGMLVVTVAPDAARQFREDGVAALLYVTNWWYVIEDQTYFDAVGRPPLLQHLWSLGLEEQFYLVWPWVLLLLYRRWRVRGVLLGAGAGALASTILMAALHDPAGDTARVYFGSDTHAMAVLTGAALACWYRPGRLPPSLASGAQRILDGLALGSLVLLIAVFAWTPSTATWLYEGGFLAVAVLSAILIVGASHPASRLAPALGVAPMRWLGSRSYAIYLWHWPLFLFLRPGLDIPIEGIAASALAISLTLLAAEASYRWVEQPFRDGRAQRMFLGWWRWAGLHSRGRLAAVTLTIGLTLLLVLPLYRVTYTDVLGGVTAVGAEPLPAAGSSQPGASPSASKSTPRPTNTSGPIAAPATEKRISAPITAVGDSVLLGARRALATELPNVTIDAAISRQPKEILGRVEQRRRAGQLEDSIVIHLGSNGRPYAEDLRPAFDRWRNIDHIVLVNVASPVEWQDPANQNLSTVAKDYPNVTLVDWRAISRGHREYFTPDGVHLTTAGARAYAKAIASAIAKG